MDGVYKDHDYTGLNVKETVFATLLNRKGVPQDYRLDILTASDCQKEGSPEEKKPVIIFIHGGGFTMPHDKRQGYIPTFARKFVEMGFTVISPDYPVFENEVEYDAAYANGFAGIVGPAAKAIVEVVRYLDLHAAELCLDMSRLFVGGGSAGGMTAIYATVLLKDRIRCVVNCWGSPYEAPCVTGFPPVFSVHGTADELVAYELETAFQKELERANVVHELVTLEGAPHTPVTETARYFPAMEAFMRRYM